MVIFVGMTLRLYESTLSKLWVDYSKSNVVADIEQLTHDADRIYLYGNVTCDPTAKNLQARNSDSVLLCVHHGIKYHGSS